MCLGWKQISPGTGVRPALLRDAPGNVEVEPGSPTGMNWNQFTQTKHWCQSLEAGGRKSLEDWD